jgi:hypothetical protein
MLIFAAAVFASSSTSVTRAAQVSNLYSAEVPVPDKAPAARDVAFSTALKSVFIKLTGKRSPQTSSLVAGAIREPAQYVEQFQYRTLTLEPIDETELGSEELLLWTQFDAVAVDRLLGEANLPRWGHTRPSVLVWLALENESTRDLVGETESSTLIEVLKDAASRRGVPLIIPLLDENDRTRLTVADVWAGFDDAIAVASTRYHPDAILVVRGHQTGGGEWQSRWRLSIGDLPSNWVATDSRLDVVLVEGIDRTADALAARYAGVVGVANAGGDRVPLSVSSVRSVSDYARVLEYLTGLDGVSRVDVTGVDADELTIGVEARGGASVVAQIISLGRTLMPVPGGSSLQYRLRP